MRGVPLSIVSFNVRYPNSRDGANAWPNRKDIAVRALQDMAPDVFGLQEAYYEQILYIHQHMPDYAWFGRDRYGVHTNEHMAIFYDTTKLRLDEQGDFWLSDTPDVPMSMTWGNSLPRMATWGLFTCLSGGKRFYVLNTHLHHTADADNIRSRSADLIAERVSALSPHVPVILIGDLNTSDLSEAYRILTNPVADLFRDTRSIAATLSGPSATYHGFRGVGINRIDYILVRGAVTVKEYTVNTFNEDGRYPSDHFPVWVRLELAEQGQEQQDTEVRSKKAQAVETV
ncbi:MAG TPA: endonuclease/exonuclease/phosphatase family protein [Firmicutes bacterium]|jgi:endonuclease/exonuclease/phosphatase family metal-dependent hydrolase|nr:endonuclease/exonuclease/phosphatase family protein [Bacillota bacterium]